MKIFVCIKQVPGVSEVRLDPKTNSLVREGIPSITNPIDKHAIELALTIKEKRDAEVIAISMGPPQAEEVLREALAMGVDKAILLSDKAFAGADTLATSYTLAIAIKDLLKGSKDKANYLVILGAQAIDGDTGQVGPELAEELNIPQITYVQKFDLEVNKITAERAFRIDELVVIEAYLPALITVLKELNDPRIPTIAGITRAFKKEVKVINAKELKPDKRRIGRHGSMTEVWKVYVPERKSDQIMLSGTNEEIVQELCKNLKDDKLI
ncbi:MAG: electron transfer flavoprotein subunit beta/FixA family protein [Candidatus Thorarchaeota archaeon]